MSDDIETDGPHSKGVAFGLWLACLFLFCGLHRFYLGRPLSGLLYFLTFGLFGVGQIVDLVLLPGMVTEANTKHAALRALAEKRALKALQMRQLPAPSGAAPEQPPEQFRIKLVQAAAKYGGALTVTQGVLATGKAFEEVERELDSMAKSGYVDITNDEKTGMVVYNFGQL
jgi:TM2 domain-containing membrane protein YozV